MINITKEQLIALKPCEPEMRLALWGDAESLNVEQALTRGYTVSDILWVAGELGLERQCVIFGVRCARLVLHLNPDPRVSAAIDAAQAWLDNPCAADAICAASATTAAARAATDAAFGASDAAYGAARAARAAAHAACVTADAALFSADFTADHAADHAALYAAYAARAADADVDAAIEAILIDVFSQQPATLCEGKPDV